jgi:hypothetical protein
MHADQNCNFSESDYSREVLIVPRRRGREWRSGNTVRHNPLEGDRTPPLDHQPRTATERNAMYHTVHIVLESRSVFRMSMVLIYACALLPQSALAQQAPASQSVAQVISCVSKPGERQVCAADTAAGWRCCARPATPAASWGRPGDMTTRAFGCPTVARASLLSAAPARRAGERLCRNVRAIRSMAYPPGRVQ